MFVDFARRDLESTAKSFRSWDTCMDNRTCKIVAIVLIVLGGIFALWVISTLIQCLCMGVSCVEALCCCCCRRTKSQPTYVVAKQEPQYNPNMYPPRPAPQYAMPQPPMAQQYQQPPLAYVPNQGYAPVSTNSYVTDDRSFEDDKNTYRGYR